MDFQMLISLCAAALVFCIGIIILLYERNKKSLLSSLDSENTDFIDSFREKTQKRLQKKPWAISYRSYLFLAFGGALFLGILSYLVSGNPIIVIFATALGVYLPELIMLIQDGKRKTLFEERFARSLRQFAGALKSGKSIQLAVEDICTSEFIHESVKEEYKQLSADLRLGLSIPEAFERFAERVHCQDAKDVSIAITMQLHVGGREAQVIESIAKSISSRMMMRKETKSMFAGANMTVLVMDIMPFAIVAFLSFFGGYMTPVWQNTVMTIIFVCLLAFMGIGSVITHNMVNKMRRECGL